MTDTTATRTVGDNARELHTKILNFVAGRGSVPCDALKREAASMSGRGGTSANAVASVAIHQLEREGKIERSKSGKSWRIPQEEIVTEPTATMTDYAREHDIDPADLVSIVNADPDPVESAGPDPLGRRIETREGAYVDALYPVAYLDLAAGSIGTSGIEDD